MGEELAGRYPYVRDFFSETAEKAGVDVAATFFGSGSPSLHDDLPAQVGVFAVSVAVLDVLEREFGLLPAAAAGYSLGTYAAFVASGALDRWDALQVLVEVERLLRETPRSGGMAFVIGVGAEEVEREIRNITPDPRELSIGNRNAPRQVVLTGRGEMVRAALEALAPRALRSGLLPVSWPMHSTSLDPVAAPLRKFVLSRGLRLPSRARLFAPMLSREVVTMEEAAEVLACQVARPASWEGTLRAISAAGIRVFAEAGPGDVLARMLRWTLRDARSEVLEDPESIARFAARREREAS